MDTGFGVYADTYWWEVDNANSKDIRIQVLYCLRQP